MHRILVVILLLLSQAALADDWDVSALSDSYISENAASSNFGSNQSVLVGSFSSSGSMQCALLRFDVSGIPSGSTINSGSLAFRKVDGDATGGFAIAIYRRTASWSEGSVNWSNSGIQSDQLVGSCVVNADFNFPVCISDAIVAIVDQWVNQGIPNHGFLLCPGIENGNILSLASREGLQAPQLGVNFTPDASGPPSPTLQTPGDGSTTNDSTPFFNWTSASGAVDYQIQVDDFTSFSTPVRNEIVGASNYTPSALPDDEYFWRVRARNSAGIWGDWTPVWSFTISTAPTCSTPGQVQLQSPPSGSTTTDSTPTLDWGSASNANQYQVEVDNASNFSSVDRSATRTSTDWTVSPALQDGVWYWRVRGRNTQGSCNETGPWSSSRSFQVSTSGPSAPTLQTPGNGSTTSDSTPLFDWTSVPGAVDYQIQVDDFSSFNTPVRDQLRASSSYQASTLADGEYYWRVRARNSAGILGDWSPVWSFTISTAPTCSTPGQVQLQSPPSGSTTTDSTPTLDWESASNANQYQVEVYNPNTFDFDRSVSITSTAWTVAPAMEEGVWYWRVRGLNTQGSCNVRGPWSSEWSLQITAGAAVPSRPSSITYPNSSVTGVFTVAWSNVSGATRYELQRETNDGSWQTVFNANATQRPQSLSNGTYRFRVRACNTAGCSAWRTGSPVMVQIPTGPVVDEPSGSVNLTVNPNLSCPGFYIFRSHAGPGSQPGRFGAELLLEGAGSRTLQGGLNFGGRATQDVRGFAAFNIANANNEAQAIALEVDVAAAGQLVLEKRSGGVTVDQPIDVIVQPGSSNFEAVVEPGFYVVGYTPFDSQAVTYSIAALTSYPNRPGGGFQGGVVFGGYHDPEAAASGSQSTGFAGFCISREFDVFAQVLSAPTYGSSGSRGMAFSISNSLGDVFIDTRDGNSGEEISYSVGIMSELPMPLRRAGVTSRAVNGYIFVFGGHPGSEPYSNRVLKYDIGSNAWTDLGGSLPYGMFDGSNNTAVFDDSAVYITPSRGPASFNGFGQNRDILRYDMAANTFQAVAQFSQNSWGITPHASGQYIYLFGRHTGVDHRSGFRFEPGTDELVNLGNLLPNPTSTPAVVEAPGDILLIIGGRGQWTSLGIFDVSNETVVSYDENFFPFDVDSAFNWVEGNTLFLIAPDTGTVHEVDLQDFTLSVSDFQIFSEPTSYYHGMLAKDPESGAIFLIGGIEGGELVGTVRKLTPAN